MCSSKRIKFGLRMVIAGIAWSLLSQPVLAEPPAFWSRFLGNQIWRMKALACRVTFQDLRFTGYHSKVWTPSKFESVVTQEGIYSPLVRRYAEFNQVDLKTSLEATSFLNSAPEEVLSMLTILHLWEDLHSNSPFISTSKNGETAAHHGPFHYSFNLFSSGLPNYDKSVIFVLRPRSKPYSVRDLFKKAARAWRVLTEVDTELWHLDQEIQRYELEHSSAARNRVKTLKRARVISSWLIEHDWLFVITSTQSEVHRPDPAQKARVFRTELFKKFDNRMTWGANPGGGFLNKEEEDIYIGHIAAEDIREAYLYNSQGILEQKFAQ